MNDRLKTDLTQAEFERWSHEIDRRIDTRKRLPDSPFRIPGYFRLTTYGWVRGPEFADLLNVLTSDYGDRAILIATLDPEPAAFRKLYGYLPWIVLEANVSAESYSAALSYGWLDNPANAVMPWAARVLIAGTSGAWEVWGERDWDLGIIRTERSIRRGSEYLVPFLSAASALSLIENELERELSSRETERIIESFYRSPAGG